VFRLDRAQRDGLILILFTVFGYSTFPLWVDALSVKVPLLEAKTLSAVPAFQWVTLMPSGGGLPSFDMATWRFLVAAPLIWVIIRGRGKRSLSVPIPRRGLLLSGTLMAGAAVTGIMGVQIIPASIYVTIFYSFPAISALISVLRGERLGAQVWLALALTLVGVVLTVPDLGEGLQQGANAAGVALALTNGLLVAVYYHVTSYLLRGCDDTPRASVYSVAGALLPLLAVSLVRGLVIPTNISTWGLMFGFAAVCTVMPIVTLNAGIQKLGAPRAAILSTVEPLLTLTWAVLLLGERPEKIQLVGGALILASVILLQVRRSTADAPAALAQDQAASL
jgi:drug/metabolite transporter (DMT)-like permease